VLFVTLAENPPVAATAPTAAPATTPTEMPATAANTALAAPKLRTLERPIPWVTSIQRQLNHPGSHWLPRKPKLFDCAGNALGPPEVPGIAALGSVGWGESGSPVRLSLIAGGSW
jgi:hypothetical protein